MGGKLSSLTSALAIVGKRAMRGAVRAKAK
jgi:hypothetical protein